MKSYEKWIKKTQEEVQEAIREAELADWHHYPEGSYGATIYTRLLTWEAALAERRERIEYPRGRNQKGDALA